MPPLILSGKADKAKAPAAGHRFEVPETFDVGDATFGTGQMGLEVGLAFRRRADRFDPECGDALVGEPVHGIDMQAGKVMQVGRRVPNSSVR